MSIYTNKIENIDFFDSSTERIHNKLLKKDKINYTNFITKQIQTPLILENNEIQNNCLFSFDCFQIIEFYSRNDLKTINRIFDNFKKKADKKSKEKYVRVSKDLDNAKTKIINDISSSNITWFEDLIIKINSENISHLTISIESNGPSLFRVIFNCYLNDDFRYKYWQEATSQVKTSLQIKSRLTFTGKKYTFTTLSGFERKRKILYDFEVSIYEEFNDYIGKYFPGIFSSIYSNLPFTCICTYIDNNNLPLFIHRGQIYNISQNPSEFFRIISNTDGIHHDIYRNVHRGDIYVVNNKYKADFGKVAIKYFRRENYSIPIQMTAWLIITDTVLFYQYDFIKKIQNNYYDIDLFEKKRNTKKLSKQLKKVSALSNFIFSSFEHDRFYYNEVPSGIDSLVIDYGSTTKSLLKNYLESINNIYKHIEKKVPSLSNLSKDRYEEENNKSNLNIQLILVALTIFTVTQSIIQCKNDNKQEQIIIENRIQIQVHEKKINTIKIEKMLEKIKNIINEDTVECDESAS